MAAKEVDVASVYVAKRIVADVSYLYKQGVLDQHAAASIQRPILALTRCPDVELYSHTFHGNVSVEPVRAVKQLSHPQSGYAAGADAPPALSGPPEDLAKALYAFDTKAYDELSFREGDWIVVTERFSKDWYRGYVRGTSGGDKPKLFPANYVELMNPNPPVPVASAYPPAAGGAAAPGGDDKWKKAMKSRAGQAAVGGAAFGERLF